MVDNEGTNPLNTIQTNDELEGVYMSHFQIAAHYFSEIRSANERLELLKEELMYVPNNYAIYIEDSIQEQQERISYLKKEFSKYSNRTTIGGGKI